MKLSQLMLAGDYLTYKGDWVTNTAYNVNDCVTWTDGHLYEVIKAHTSSDTLAPSNTEYYKAMTASKAETVKIAYNANITGELLTKMVDAQDKGKQIIIELPDPNRPVKIIPGVDALGFYGYTTIITDDRGGYREYILTGKLSNRIYLYSRIVTFTNPSNAPAYSQISLDDDIKVIIGE